MWSQEEYEELREAVHDYFREFGENPCEIIFQELIRHGTMGPMLERLEVADPGNSDDQYAALLNFVRHYGIEAFARILDDPRAQVAALKREALEKRRRAMSETAANRLLLKLRRRDDAGLPTEFEIELPPSPPRPTPPAIDDRPAAVLYPGRPATPSKLPPSIKRQFARVKVDLDAVVHESADAIPLAQAAPPTPAVPAGTEVHPPLERPATPPEINPPTPLPASGMSLPRGFVPSDKPGVAGSRKRPAVLQKVVAEPPVVRPDDPQHK